MKIFFFDIETIPTDRRLSTITFSAAQMRLDEPEIIKKLSLSAATARILCLAYAIEPQLDSPVKILHGTEAEILRSFWKLAADCHLFVGHNVLDFDLRFIYQRSIIHQIRPSREIPLARFRNNPVYDTMHEWSQWGREHISLDLARARARNPIAERKSRWLEGLSLLLRGKTAGDLRLLQTRCRNSARGLSPADVYLQSPGTMIRQDCKHPPVAV